MAKKDLYVEETKIYIESLCADAESCTSRIKDARRDIKNSELIIKLEKERLGIINKRFLDAKSTLAAYQAKKNKKKSP